ncbi:hypothetical protein HMPREF1429_00740 [Helicobacter pylori GAM93Bi]|nr:hypothetical protein HMPREF1429_00740 [Helicobacter pylori GAM93Bi]
MNPLFLEAKEITWSQFLENFKNKNEDDKPKPLTIDKNNEKQQILDKNQQILKRALEKSLNSFSFLDTTIRKPLFQLLIKA